MSSILTNQSAMIALETLRGVNKNLLEVQSNIATGKRIASAKDNAAVWAISKVMSTDASSFKQITDSLNLGSSTVGVARVASEKVTDLLQEMKNLIVSAQEENVDRTKIQTDVDVLVEQINSIVDAAQFNGLNLLKGGGSINILASLNRAANGDVTAANITVNRNDLQISSYSFGGAGATITGTLAGDTAGTLADGDSATVTYTAAALTEGESFRVRVGATDYEYVARANDTLNDVVAGLQAEIDADNLAGVTVSSTSVSDPEATDSVLTITNGTGAGFNISIAGASGGTAGGGLAAIDGIDVTTTATADAALTNIETAIQAAIDAAAAFGSAQTRIDIQNEFATSLIDSLKTGISALTDTDMEEASARLQSLQVQQQLGIQSLAIANQSPQAVLALFAG